MTQTTWRWKAREGKVVRRHLAITVGVLCVIGGALHSPAWAQAVSVSDGGQASFTYPITLPPSIAGLGPQVGLVYGNGSTNGPAGLGWALQGSSVITRCPATRLIDGATRGVRYDNSDKLCLDGQRLIQTDETGNASAATQQGSSLPVSTQVDDARGLASGFREFRTEKDNFARIRAYGMAGGAEANGPAYFRMWTKNGQMFEFGTSPAGSVASNALITAQGKTVAIAWPVSRITESVGNYADFKYSVREVAWGSGPASAAIPGKEWNLIEIQYTGNSLKSQPPTNKVVFEYVDRVDDRSETFHEGSKSVVIQRLSAIRTFVNSANPMELGPAANALKARLYKLSYTASASSRRSLLERITECSPFDESKCLPATVFQYSAGQVTFAPSAAFNLSTTPLIESGGTGGVFTGDFNGDGRTDLFRWSTTTAQNAIYFSNGDGTFGNGNGGMTPVSTLTNYALGTTTGCIVPIIRDFNGDGILDILRVTKYIANTDCGTPVNELLLGDGVGGFATPKPLPTSIDFRQIESVFSISIDRSANTSTKRQTEGRNYYIFDVNDDGFPDIVATVLPFYSTTGQPPTPAAQCASITCTRIFYGSAAGTFAEFLGSNLVHQSVYSPINSQSVSARRYRYNYVSDYTGDGLADIPAVTGLWASLGNGNFELKPTAEAPPSCISPIDFNGDGRMDCLLVDASGTTQTINVATGSGYLLADRTFNLTVAADPLLGSTRSFDLIDVNGDGLADILSWDNNPTLSKVYLSNADGSFRTSTEFNLNVVGKELGNTDGSISTIAGDFLGKGHVELLRLRRSPAATSEGTKNQLYVKTAAETGPPPDMLLSVTGPSGARTTLKYATLSTLLTSGQYKTDRGTGNAAAYPKVDITTPMQVVKELEKDTGVRATASTFATVSTQYAYRGLKMSHNGAGFLGFRQVLQQYPASNGEPITVINDALQDHPYIGTISQTKTVLGTWTAADTAPVLSLTTSIYCDKMAAAGAETSATVTAPCPTPSAKVRRPYLYKAVEQGWDLNGTPLPVNTTINTFNNNGNALTVNATTVGTAAGGLSQTVTKVSTNEYHPDNIAGDTWLLGQLKRASVQSTVPNSMASITASAGTATYATAQSGSGAPPPLNPAVLAVILQLLLED